MPVQENKRNEMYIYIIHKIAGWKHVNSMSMQNKDILHGNVMTCF